MASATARKTWTIVLSVVLVLVLGGAGYWFFLRSDSTSSADPAGSTSSVAPSRPNVIDPPVAIPSSQISPVALDSGKVPTPDAVVARLAGPLANQALGSFNGVITDAATGTVLWKQNPATPQIPASSLKLLTGAAVLQSMDPNTRLTTTVVQGANPGEVVFVGGGDVTLSAAPAGVRSIYAGAPTVTDLANQIKASGATVTKILTDTTLWADDPMAEGWTNDDITGSAIDGSGYVTKMYPLMVDGDRIDASNVDSKRTGDPVTGAAQALARALGSPDLSIEQGATAPAGAKVLATVQSQPVSLLLSEALLNSDNTLAEALGRLVALKQNAKGSFTQEAIAIENSLKALGLDTDGLQLFDASGLSPLDQVPPQLLADVISLAVSGKVPALTDMLAGLPVAGVSGTLAATGDSPRFNSDTSRPGAGWVRAKTGSVAQTYALVGYVPDVDGRILVFSFNSNGVGSGTRDALDTLAATLRQCGCS